jgi:hypothetical protein
MFRGIIAALAFISLVPDMSLAQDYPIQQSQKFVCGKGDQRVAILGTYLTAINIHNPLYTTVPFRWKAAVALPKLAQGPISQFATSRLGPDGAAEITCNDIRALLGASVPNVSLLTGFVVIESRNELDVVGVYSAADPSGRSIALEVLTSTARNSKPQSQPDLIVSSACTSDNKIVSATVSNTGNAPAGSSVARFTFTPTSNANQPVGPSTMADVPTPALVPGGSAVISAPIPPLCYQPNCRYAVQVDITNVVVELNEGNNAAGDLCIG